jgi:hypothetical protein
LDGATMKDIALHINYKTKPEKLAGSLRSQDLKQGDKLIVNSILSEEMTLMIVILILYYFKQQKIDYADEMLKDIFATKGSKEIHDEIAREYGIEIEIKSTNEEDNWYQFSKEKLAKAYGTDEPEYDESMVNEPNPDYNKQ